MYKLKNYVQLRFVDDQDLYRNKDDFRLSSCDHTFSKSKSREWVGYKRTREGLPGIMSEKSVKIVILFIPFFWCYHCIYWFTVNKNPSSNAG